jgi:phosphate:Na+ symporter
MIDTGNSYLLVLMGGVALFLYGMTLTSQSLEKLLSQRISGLLKRLSENQFLSIVTGISLTTLMQSSGAVTSMLVGLGSARVITLKQVMGVIIGTAIGSTLTVQLISFNVSPTALPLFSLFHFLSISMQKNQLSRMRPSLLWDLACCSWDCS